MLDDERWTNPKSAFTSTLLVRRANIGRNLGRASQFARTIFRGPISTENPGEIRLVFRPRIVGRNAKLWIRIARPGSARWNYARSLTLNYSSIHRIPGNLYYKRKRDDNISRKSKMTFSPKRSFRWVKKLLTGTVVGETRVICELPKSILWKACIKKNFAPYFPLIFSFTFYINSYTSARGQSKRFQQFHYSGNSWYPLNVLKKSPSQVELIFGKN